MPTIRPITADDIDAVTALYAHHVLTGTGTFEIDPPSAADMAARIADVQAKGLPYLVLAADGSEDRIDGEGHGGASTDGEGPRPRAVLGFAYCNWFKPRPAYRYSAEDSIYLAPGAAGRGWGRLLLAALAAQAEAAGVRKLVAVIGDSANAGSIGVHRAAGFTQVGVLRAMGWKFGQWRDIVLMEKPLGAGDTTDPE